MLKYIFSVMLVFFYPFNVMSEWKLISKKSSDVNIYIDFEKIDGESRYGYTWILVDGSTPETDGSMSQLLYVNVDCKKTQIMYLETKSFSNNMGKGEIITNQKKKNSDWSKIKPKTIEEVIRDQICMMIGHDTRLFDKFYEDHPDYKDHLKNRDLKKNKLEKKEDSDWKYYTFNTRNEKYYLNEKTFKKDGQFIYFGVLTDHETKTDELNNSYNSSISTHKVDCSTNKIRVEQIITYKKKNG